MVIRNKCFEKNNGRNRPSEGLRLELWTDRGGGGLSQSSEYNKNKCKYILFTFSMKIDSELGDRVSKFLV